MRIIYYVIGSIVNFFYNLDIQLAILFGTYRVEDKEPADYEDLANF